MSQSALVHVGEHDELDLADIELCKRIGAILLDHYPGHAWHIAANSEINNGTIDIKLAYPDKLGILPKFGYKLHIATWTEQKVMRAGGELLERYRMARGRATPYARMDAIINGLDKTGMI